MAGNAKPRGAVRKSKKGPTTGTGGKNKRRLEGKGPTPKAEDVHITQLQSVRKLRKRKRLVHQECQRAIAHVVKSLQAVTQF